MRDLSIGVDIGGTFTDCVVAMADGRIVPAKSPTTPTDRSIGFFQSIERAAEKIGMPVSEMFARCQRLVHGTTTGTNAIVSRAGAKVGLLTTSGHRDILFMMRGSGRTIGLPPDQLLDISETYKPEPLVPRSLVREVIERVDVDGEVIVSLDESSVRKAAESLLASGVDAIAISFLWSIKNDSHERRAEAIISELAPHVFVTRGSALVGVMGEYERTTTAVINAYIGPLMLDYIAAIESGARERGYQREVLFAQCGGGAITGTEARAAPIRTVQSGPVAGIVASQYLAQSINERNVIAADMGGTTFDVSVIRDGEPLERNTSVFQRLELALPMFDVESIGAGGGSIAWVDEFGRLNVGPQSAGADPGPACYGVGELPTTTDADVVLGIIDPERFLGGRMKIDAERSRAAIGRVAEQLGLELHEAAAGICRIVDSKMADLIRRMSVMRGFDPRAFACFAFGGGGPVHAVAVARDAGLRRVIVPLPEVAAVWSALGTATSDIVHVYQRSDQLEMPFDLHLVRQIFSELDTQALEQLHSEGFDDNDIRLQRRLRMRYATQVHDVDVTVTEANLADDSGETLLRTFSEIYEGLFGQGSGYREGGSEITGFHLRASGVTARRPVEARRDGRMHRECDHHRAVYWGELKSFVDTPVWLADGDSILPDLQGPALVQLPDTVIVINPGCRARSDQYGNFVIELPG